MSRLPHANGHTSTGRIHDRIPGWMESCFWLWYAPRVHDVICSKIAKLIGFTADESTSLCVGTTADPVSRRRTGSTAVGSNYISTIASKSNQHIGFWIDTTTTKSSDDDTAQVSYRFLCPDFLTPMELFGYSMTLQPTMFVM